MPPIQHECQKAQEAIMELLAADNSAAREALKPHLEHCPACRELSVELTCLQNSLSAEAAGQVPKVPEALWNTLTHHIDHGAIRQEGTSPGEFVREGPSLLFQYSYLVVLSMTLWVGLAFGQPVFTSLLSGVGIALPHWFLVEYGLFLVFFTSGGFFAILAAPILIRANRGDHSGQELNGWQRLWRRLATKLRVFSVLTC